MKINLKVNHREVAMDVDPRLLLVDFLREHLRLTGTHVGCDTTQCGACTVHLDGMAVKSCALLAVQTDGCEIVTVEGLAAGGQLHPMQQSFHEHHALQCGFCTPGMIMAGIEIRRRSRAPDRDSVRRDLDGNICRCTGYQPVVDAILDARMEADDV